MVYAYVVMCAFGTIVIDEPIGNLLIMFDLAFLTWLSFLRI